MHAALAALESQRKMTEYFDNAATEHVTRQFYAAFTTDSPIPSIAAHFPRPYSSWADQSDEELGPRAEAVRLTLAKNLRLADPYWVQSNMIDLVDMAYADMPSHPMTQETLPVPFGWMYLSRRVTIEAQDWSDVDLSEHSSERSKPSRPAMAFSAISWKRATQVNEQGVYRPGYEIWFYVDRDDVEATARAALGNRRWTPYTVQWMPPYVPSRAMFWADGEISPDDTVSILDMQISSWFQAAVILMDMPIAAQAQAPHDRKTNRRMEKANLPIRQVTIVMMRSPRSRKIEDGEDHEGREYSHRWLVDGHWRNQYYPSTGEHKVIYIHPYVKGPEDKQLIVKKKVHAWVR